MGLHRKNPGKKDDDGIVDSETKLSMDYFKREARKKNSSDDNRIAKIKSKYKVDFLYGSTKDPVTEQIKAERAAKKDAEPAVYIETNRNNQDDGLVFIKEGTVIGRTYTNQEIYKMRSKNNEADEFMDKIKLNDDGVPVMKSEETELVIQGNYLRILMRSEDGSIIENVEDYMKLDTDINSKLFEAPIIKKIDASESQIKSMAAAIEAETDSPEEYVAFAWLIRNRYESSSFSNSLNNIIDSFKTKTPSDMAISAARNVLNGEVVSPIADRCYYSEKGTPVPGKADPVQVPFRDGKIYHYDINNIKNHDYRDDIAKVKNK